MDFILDELKNKNEIDRLEWKRTLFQEQMYTFRMSVRNLDAVENDSMMKSQIGQTIVR